MRATSSFASHVGHQGLYHDPETGLIHNRARYRHPTLGRWVGRDPLGYVDGLSVYEYVKSSPYRFSDPSGLRVPSIEDENWDSIGESFLCAAMRTPREAKDALTALISWPLANAIGSPEEEALHNARVNAMANGLWDIPGNAWDWVGELASGDIDAIGEFFQLVGGGGLGATGRGIRALGTGLRSMDKPNVDIKLPSRKSIPDKAKATLDHIRETGKPPQGYEGGRKFKNREGKLPEDGSYKEYDIDPRPRDGSSRNAERIVVDTKSSRAWYTDDHYSTFTEIQ